MPTLSQIKYYTRGNNTTNGNPVYLIDAPYQFTTVVKIRKNAPVTLTINKNSSIHYDATTGKSIIHYNIKVSTYNILDTIDKLNKYIDTLNQNNQ